MPYTTVAEYPEFISAWCALLAGAAATMAKDADATEFRASLAAQLRAAGVRAGGPLLVHSSMSSLGHVPGGPDTVLDALQDAVGDGGTLVLPTLSYLFTTE